MFLIVLFKLELNEPSFLTIGGRNSFLGLFNIILVYKVFNPNFFKLKFRELFSIV